MIPFDFEYYKPDTIEEAVQIFKELDAEGKEPKYYSGGTEIISMSRTSNLYTGAVIDIKGIPQCNEHEFKNDNLIIGSAVTLTQIAEANSFPLLRQTAKRVADHTIQDKVTLGGNVCGTIIYHEAILPLMLSDCNIVIAGDYGEKIVPITEVYHKGLRLPKGELIVKFIIHESYVHLPYFHVKKVKKEKIDYPLITAAALKKDNHIKIAFSGLCDFPFESNVIEKDLNNNDLSVDDRIYTAISHITDPVIDDILGSSKYRKYVMVNILHDAVTAIGMN